MKSVINSKQQMFNFLNNILYSFHYLRAIYVQFKPTISILIVKLFIYCNVVAWNFYIFLHDHWYIRFAQIPILVLYLVFFFSIVILKIDQPCYLMG
jgi:hypothetical protein